MEVNPKLKSAVIQLKSGNDEAFGEVYASTYNYVYFRARQIMKNEDDAMDLMQIVYMEAYKSIANLDKPESIYSWLSSITFRQGMKLFQKNKEILLDEDFENIFDSMESSDRDSRPELSIERKEQQELLASLIDSLPEVQRATMVAFYYDNIKIEEIADVMGCSVGTVKSRLSYARQALKKKLEAADRREGRGKGGKMALTAGLLFGAIQLMSEETVLAAPLAAGAFGNICSGLGIAATGAALAGTALAGGAGVSAATGTVTTAATAATAAASTTAAAATTAATTAAGTAATTAATTVAGTAATTAATTAAGTAAAAGTAVGTAAATVGTAAAATGAAGAAAAGTAAGAAGAAAGGIAATGAAKGIAVAVAVAVAGTGGTVGTTIYRNSVSSADSTSVNEESSNAVISDSDIESGIYEDSTDEMAEEASFAGEESPYETEPSTEATGAYEEEASEAAPVTVEEPVAENGDKEEAEEAEEAGKEEEQVSDNSLSENSLSENTAATGRFKMSDKNKAHVAGAVASLFMMSNCNVYNGKVDNETLEAAYLLESGKVLSNKEIKTLSGNQVYLKAPKISSATVTGDLVTLNGSFSAGRMDENGNNLIDNYVFVLTGTREKEKGIFGTFRADSLVMVHNGAETVEVISSPSVGVPENPGNAAEPVQENVTVPDQVQEPVQDPVSENSGEAEETVSAVDLPLDTV